MRSHCNVVRDEVMVEQRDQRVSRCTERFEFAAIEFRDVEAKRVRLSLKIVDVYNR